MNKTRYDYINRLDHKSPSTNNILGYVLLIALLIITFTSLIKGIDTSIENQDKMLCASALESENEEYLEKCECYYNTNDIQCLQR